MSLAEVVKKRTKRPRKTMLYGPHGIGKSTWPSKAPKPLVISTEGGLGDINIEHTPTCKEFGDVVKWISTLHTEKHDYKTVVIDTVDWLEQMIHRVIATEKGKPCIADIDYGKGYEAAITKWQHIFSGLDSLVDNVGMSVVLLAHAKIVPFADPNHDRYDRYMPDLHKSVCDLVQEWCDEVFFATIQSEVTQTEEGFGKTRTRAVGDGQRVVHTTEKPTHLAKRRLPLPDVIALDYSVYFDAICDFYGTFDDDPDTGNIAGIVVDGSSKKEVAPAT